MPRDDLIKTAFLLAIIILSGCSSKMTFPRLSEKIYKINGGVNDKSTFKLSFYKRDARMKAYLVDSPTFLKETLKDTLYVLEGYNIETATFYGRIWNKKNEMSYSYTRGAFVLEKHSVFTDYQIKLIINWDSVQIRKEEKINGNWLDNNLLINGIRCYQKGNSWEIDQISFKNFFNSKRDSKVPEPASGPTVKKDQKNN